MLDPSFRVEATCGAARAGVLSTAHGKVHTPVFMPVGTAGTVKAMLPAELEQLGAEIVLGNTYHLYLRPGLEVVAACGGLHRMMGWSRATLTDSGGYQVFSLQSLRRVSDDGVRFRSHIDGSEHLLDPERSLAIQAALGADIAMALDECPPGDAPRAVVEDAMRRTTLWAQRSLAAHRSRAGSPALGKPGQPAAPSSPADAQSRRQALFGIVQGGVHLDLRLRHLEELAPLPFDGLAVGGLSVGEPLCQMYDVLAELGPRLPAERPRYLMGVGTPRDLVFAIGQGIDMFDCVIPTRNARNGQLFTSQGRLTISNARHRLDPRPVDESCACSTCRSFSRAYLRHLFMAREILYNRLATLHNLHYYLSLVRAARLAIVEGRYPAFAAGFAAGLTDRWLTDRET